MINHLRTLLLDTDGADRPGPDYPGEEYVPPDFRIRPMAAPLRQVWRTLFGVNPDRAYRNFRLRQYTTLVHGTALAEFALALDPRVTYWPQRADDPRWVRYGTATVEPAGAAAPDGLQLLGAVAADDAAGRCAQTWRVEVLPGNTVAVDDRPVPAGYAAGRSVPIALGLGLSCTVSEAVGSVWFVSALGRPTRDVGTVLAATGAAAGATETLLFAGGAPYAQLGQLWQRTDFLPTRLGALIVALAYRINDARGLP